MPAPDAHAESEALSATTMFLSTIVTVSDWIDVVVPCTLRLPTILTSPATSPNGNGSMLIVAGPRYSGLCAIPKLWYKEWPLSTSNWLIYAFVIFAESASNWPI